VVRYRRLAHLDVAARRLPGSICCSKMQLKHAGIRAGSNPSAERRA